MCFFCTVHFFDFLDQKFYLEGRTKAAFPFHESLSYPVVNMHVEYSAVRSTKADMLVALVCHHLSMDLLMPVLFDEHPKLPCVINADSHVILNRPWIPGTNENVSPYLLWTPLETGENVQIPKSEKGSQKILIYHKFSMMAPLILLVSGTSKSVSFYLPALSADTQDIWSRRCGNKWHADHRGT